MALEILYDARPAGLNHSLYDAPEVRDRVALWLREQAGAPAAGLCRTRGEARARPREPTASRIAAARKRTGDG